MLLFEYFCTEIVKMTCKNTIQKINSLAKEKIPFLFILDFDLEKPVVIPLDKIDPSRILYNVKGKTNFTGERNSSGQFSFMKFPVSFDVYLKSFEEVKSNIDRGNSFLLNLTFPTEIKTDLSLREIFLRSKAPFKLFFSDQFTVFSPEPFVTITGDKIFSYPMKGTRDATVKDAAEKLLSDPKELAEHHTIVDLIRNDLSMVSKNVKVLRFRYLEEIQTHEKKLLQTSSEICGQLEPGWQNRLGDILFSMLPAGSVTGAPKKKTVEIIKKVEIYQRVYFTGIFGIFDGENLESAVMIRFVEKTDSGLRFRSGGGITCFSNPESEYKEMIDKVYLPVNQRPF